MSLAVAFQEYTELAWSVITPGRHVTTTTRAIKHSPQDILTLTKLLCDLESRVEFQNLIRETAIKFSNEPYKDAPVNQELWKYNVEAFFRRSGFYLSAFKGETLDTTILFARYTEAFEKKKALIRHLVPLELVDFDDYQMEFGDFRIVQLSPNDLESLLQSEINQVFYPYAYADLSYLADLWFLETTETSDTCEPGSGGIIELSRPEVAVTLTDFPPPIRRALKHLALYDWGTYQTSCSASVASRNIRNLDTDWSRFRVPFIISKDENSLWPPKALPDLSALLTEPVFNDEGEEIEERLYRSIFIESDEFKPAMQKIVDLIKGLEEKCAAEWLFLDRALDYLVKAFFVGDLDQLLWHMVVVEALLGDDKKESGLTARLRKRAVFVLAKDINEKEKIKKLMGSGKEEDLYELRSQLVHGNTKLINKRVYLGHLREARELARRASLWFLESLSNLNLQLSKRGIRSNGPTREEIIAAIDLLSDDNLNTDNVRVVLDVLSTRKPTTN